MKAGADFRVTGICPVDRLAEFIGADGCNGSSSATVGIAGNDRGYRGVNIGGDDVGLELGLLRAGASGEAKRKKRRPKGQT